MLIQYYKYIERCGSKVLTPSKSYSKERKEEFSQRYWYDLND